MTDFIPASMSLNEGRKLLNKIAEEMNNKDVSSAPEIIKAREGYSDLKEKLDAIREEAASQAPKEVFDSLNQLSSAYPNGADGIYLTVDNGHWHFWNGTTWEDGGVYQAYELGKKSVKPINASFFKDNPSNLIKPLDFTPGYIDITGNIVASPTSRSSQTYIDLNPNSVYRLQSREPIADTTIYLAMYNDSNTFTRRFDPVKTIDPNNPVLFVTGANDKKARLSVLNGQEFDLFLHEGSDLQGFEEPLVMNEDYLPKMSPSSKVDEQTDFVQKLSIHNQSNAPLKAEVTSVGNFNVYQPISAGKYIKHVFTKDALDDFTIYASAILGHFNESLWVDEQYIMAGSNKELAVFAKPSGSSSALQWFPEHNATGTAFVNEKRILFDGVDVSSLPNRAIQDVNIVTLEQDMRYLYPSDSNPLANLFLLTTISKEGVSYDGRFEFVRDTFVDRAYVAMLPTVIPPFDTLRTSNQVDYDVTKSSGTTNIQNGDNTISFAYLNKNGAKPNTSYVLAQTIHNINKTFRKDEKDRRNPMTFIEHRSTSVQKLYPQIYNLAEVKTGDSFSFGATIFVGLLNNASKLLF